MKREVFINLMIDKVNALLAENDQKKTPWTRRDFVCYIKGAADAFKYVSEEDVGDVDYLVADIFIDTVDAIIPNAK